MDRPASDQREPPTASVITTTEPDLTGDNQVRERSVDGILRLRGASDMRMQRRRVTWTEEVVDNEGLGKKKTKSTTIPQMNSSSRPPMLTALQYSMLHICQAPQIRRVI
ncbi:hypothetical protein DRE_05049 [Drechslerella stenobrocha 248]|uniref:Type 1 phosphatases regulator ypi1 n=1 Tax=Drechslerella stenobrocha 248 TaxID=1043628 RepID=W7HZR2_9PEZI|nr:hypothetical protein DRE_05049 [Drechslerella stenobrocha 248]